MSVRLVPPVGVGVIGGGKHGVRYLGHLRADVPELRVAALCRRDAAAGAAQAHEFGCAFFERWQDLVASPAVRAVVVVVPPTLHLEIATAVATAGKALLIEKPLAPSGEAAAALVRRVRRAGIPALMAHTLRWNAVVRAVHARLPQLGALRALVVNQRFEPSPLAWLDDPAIAAGGILLHTGVHSFDLVRLLTGCEVRRVHCRTVATHTRRIEDNFSAALELDGSPALVTVNGCRDTLGRSGLIDAAATQGQLVADHQQHWAHEVHGLERTPLVLGDPVPTVREVLRSFAALLCRAERPPVELEDGARAVAIAEACRRSAASGSPEDVATLGV
ncbi:MAG TPA: Gfo/Idh/MocA family oxidoreductase [Candidatus Limnocylindria bacterium]|nr:Gfo/Idh/MocA family oxidoreductase [Candidatus Limnocylindria bacterium]